MYPKKPHDIDDWMVAPDPVSRVILLVFHFSIDSTQPTEPTQPSTYPTVYAGVSCVVAFIGLVITIRQVMDSSSRRLTHNKKLLMILVPVITFALGLGQLIFINLDLHKFRRYSVTTDFLAECNTIKVSHDSSTL